MSQSSIDHFLGISPSLREESNPPQELFPCVHAQVVLSFLKSGLSPASLADDFRCHKTTDTFQFGLCKACATKYVQKSIPLIDGVRQ